MTALFLDGFDHYGTQAEGVLNMLDGVWASAPGGGFQGPGIPTWGSRSGLYSLFGGAAFNPYRFVVPGGTRDSLYISMGFSVQVLPGSDFATEIVSFCTSGNTPFARLFCQADGSILLTNGAGTPAPIIGTAGPVIVPSNWHFLEMFIDPTNGIFTLRIDDPDASGSPAISGTGITFSATHIGQLTFLQYFGGNGSGNPWMDDLFLRDSLGTINNGFLGDRRIATLYPNGNVPATQGWAPSYYQKFGSGILRLSYIVPNNTNPVNNNAFLQMAGVSSLDIGANDFTLETEIRFDALPRLNSYSTIFNYFDTNANKRSYRLILGDQGFNGGCLQFDTSTDGTSSTTETMIQYPFVPETNVWYHLALCRSSGELLLFVNGQQLGLPIADSRTYFSGGNQPFSIGLEDQIAGSVGNTEFTGRLDETRFTNGTGRYTGPFTPPTMAFPRGTSDPDWAQVVFLMGYDSGIVDESSFTRTINANGGALSFQVNDGTSLGQYSTINKVTPDDNTFIAASLTNATNILTMTSQPSNATTVTVGTKDGTVPAVYTFKTAITTAFDVLIDTTAQNTLINLFNAINAGSGSGTKYGAGTTSNFDVNAVQLPVGQIEVFANTAGTGGNSIASTSTSTASWTTSTLTGGASIPGPSEFKFQRPPNNTTIVSALQMSVRALKTDAGTSTIQDTFIGALGGTAPGATHNLTLSPVYYNDIIETDPDTMGVLTPTTITNGTFEINRTA